MFDAVIQTCLSHYARPWVFKDEKICLYPPKAHSLCSKKFRHDWEKNWLTPSNQPPELTQESLDIVMLFCQSLFSNLFIRLACLFQVKVNSFEVSFYIITESTLVLWSKFIKSNSIFHKGLEISSPRLFKILRMQALPRDGKWLYQKSHTHV